MSCTHQDRLLQTLRTQIPGVTDDMLSIQLFNVIDEFFRRTNAWRHTDEMPLEEDVSEYVFPVPSGATIVRAIAMSHNGQPIGYQMTPPDIVWLFRQPDLPMLDYPLLATMALSVHKDCLEQDCCDWGVPEWCWDSYFQAWLDGMLGRFYAMPAKPWANPQQAIYHHKRFRNEMAGHKQEAAKGFVYGVPGWVFPRAGGWV